MKHVLGVVVEDWKIAAIVNDHLVVVVRVMGLEIVVVRATLRVVLVTLGLGPFLIKLVLMLATLFVALFLARELSFVAVCWHLER